MIPCSVTIVFDQLLDHTCSSTFHLNVLLWASTVVRIILSCSEFYATSQYRFQISDLNHTNTLVCSMLHTIGICFCNRPGQKICKSLLIKLALCRGRLLVDTIINLYVYFWCIRHLSSLSFTFHIQSVPLLWACPKASLCEPFQTWSVQRPENSKILALNVVCRGLVVHVHVIVKITKVFRFPGTYLSGREPFF